MTLYDEINTNKRNSLLLVLFVLALVIGVVALYSYSVRHDFVLPIIAAIFAVPSALIGYYQGDKIALATNGAKPLSHTDMPQAYHVVENLAIAGGLPTPKVYVIDSPAINAFATGRDPAHASIAITTGALTQLTRQELEGVVAHELSHVKNYDIRFATLVAIFVGFVVILSDMFMRASFWGSGFRSRDDRENNSGQLGAILAIVGLVLLILSPVIAQLIQLAVSRQREYLADASGAMLTRNPGALADALQKIAAAPSLQTAGRATAHLYIANPFRGKNVASLFATHPPIEERIKRLRALG